MGKSMKRLLAWIERIERQIDWPALGLLALTGLVFSAGVPLPVGAVLLMVAATVSLVTPSAALGACLAATPFIFRPVDVGSRSWTLLELMLIAAGMGLAGRVVLEVAANRSLVTLADVVPKRSVLIGAGALVALAAISLANLADPGHRDASVRAVRTVIIEPLIVVPLTVRVLRRGRIEITLGALAAALVAVAGWGAVGAIRGTGVAADGVRRAIGPYTHPNNLAFFLERATLLTAVPALMHPRTRRIGWVLVAIGTAGVISTFSRGALLGMPAGLAVALWLSGRLRAIVTVGVGVLAGIGAFAVMAGDRLFDLGGDGSEPSRVVIWEGAARILQDFQITGIGPDQFYVMYGLRYIEPVGWPERYTSHPHNLFLDFWLSLGMGGLILALVAVAWIGRTILRLRRSTRNSQDLNAANGLQFAGAAALTAGIVHGMVDNSFFLADLAVLTWFALILVMNKSPLAKS
jgi:O-antigen ligase